MQFFVVMNPAKDRIYSLNMIDSAPEMRPIDQLGAETFHLDPAFLVEFILSDVWLPTLFPKREWANAVGVDFCGDHFCIVVLTVV